MKALVYVSLLVCLATVDALDEMTTQSSPQLRRSTQSGSGRRKGKRACLVIFSHKQYEDHHLEEQPVECELHADDRKRGVRTQTVKIKGLTTKWARKNNVLSGESTFFSSSALIDDSSNEIILPANAVIELGENSGGFSTDNSIGGFLGKSSPLDGFWNRKLAAVKKVLVLRIVGQDRSTTSSEASLADDIFGAAGDSINLKTQFNSCSIGELQFEPVTTNALVGTDGVYTVNMPTTVVTNQNDNDIAWAAVTKAQQDLGVTLTSIANHVMICMPPGTAGGGWVAYAYVNHWLSVYNDEWCRSPSANLHEIGHNLNLGHSNEGATEYADQSCLMGYSYGVSNGDDTPQMCFNGAKTWQLGWFPTFHVDLTAGTGFNWNGNIVGFVDKNNAAATDKMIIRIQSSTGDTYVHFNRATGFNSQVQEGGNQVLVATRSSGTGYAPSNLLAKLNSGGVYTIPNFNGSSSSVTITVNSIASGTTPWRANISIALVTGAPTRSPTSTPTTLPTTAPTRTPTVAPTSSPTRSPTSIPTRTPTAVPTSSPTGTPTTATPTGLPTDLPTNSPTSAPVTADPTSLPTSNPVEEPTPTNSPTFEPTNSPTDLPTSLPTDAPVTAAPTDLLTSTPTAEPTSLPTSEPTTPAPTQLPTGFPTVAPTASPTQSPTKAPTPPPVGPTRRPTAPPPTRKPTTARPTRNPTTRRPTRNPTVKV